MKKVLVAYDGTDQAKRALEVAAEMAIATGATIAVVSVVPVHPGRTPIDPWDDRAVHVEEAEEGRRILAERGLVAEVLIASGPTAPTIERVAEDGGFDAIVVGSRPAGSLTRFLQGSVSEHVATHAATTVVVAR